MACISCKKLTEDTICREGRWKEVPFSLWSTSEFIYSEGYISTILCDMFLMCETLTTIQNVTARCCLFL